MVYPNTGRTQKHSGYQRLVWWLCLLVNLLPWQILQAQTNLYEVFYDPATSTVYFIDIRTGSTSSYTIQGAQLTLTAQGVLYLDTVTGFARLLKPTGENIMLPFIQPTAANVQVTWLASPNQQAIYYTLTQGTDMEFLSELYVTSLDGSIKRLILKTSSTQGLAIFPVAISSDDRYLFYTRQPRYQENAYQLFPTAAELYRVDIATGATERLNGEPLCNCGVGFSPDGRTMVRLELDTDGAGFKIHWWDLTAVKETTIPATELAHKQAGYVVVSDDGNLAVYASARGNPPGSAQPERFVLVLADRAQGTQRLLTEALAEGLRPLAFTSDGQGILVAGLTTGGTYKLRFADNTLVQVAAASYLGQMR